MRNYAHSIFFLLVALPVGSASALPAPTAPVSAPVSAPAPTRVQMDVQVSVNVCHYDAQGQLHICDGRETTEIRETVTVDLVSQGCTPKCTYNDDGEFSKSYKLVDAPSKLEFDVDLDVTVSRISELFHDDIPDYAIGISLTPSQAPAQNDDGVAVMSVKDFSALNDLFVNGKTRIVPQPNGTSVGYQTAAFVQNIKLLP